MSGAPLWHAPAMLLRYAAVMSAALVACKGERRPGREDPPAPLPRPVAPEPAAAPRPVAAPSPASPAPAPVAPSPPAMAAAPDDEQATVDDGPPCPGALDVVAIRAAGPHLAIVVDDDDDPARRRQLLVERATGRVVRDERHPAPAAPELPSVDFEDDDRPAAEGVEVCPTDRPCLKLVPHHPLDERIGAVRLRGDGRLIGLAVLDDEGHDRVEVWDVVTGRRRERVALAALRRDADDDLALAFVGDSLAVLAIADDRARVLLTDGRRQRLLDRGEREIAPRSMLDLGGGRLAFLRVGPEGTELVTETVAGQPLGRGPVMVECGTNPALFDAGQGQVACVIDDDVDSITITVVDGARGSARATRVVCE